ncbi:diadenylate cyclase [Allorhodopirellula solitaria]|uniref:DNA integrity scanning protein DisA n=1 Tax=Allorhodopirellula solitaria TaxID=2527987 RepID=A0A5C5XT92_9BACT|nr:diadenylate cyclase [Allorhodopirellula solitaria]TWT66476.1 DNA integrity scanning protein DisA [Allorhodopirellula solitaria]
MLSSEVFSQVRVADFVDIAIVSIVIYLLLLWLRGRASRSLGIVLVLLMGTFLLARGLDLYMTTAAFQYGFIGLLLSFVLVFQQDIRHGVERLGAHRWFATSGGNAPLDDVNETIVEAVAAMAKQRMGALIVFPGLEPLDRHVRGGVDVNADISFPLLLSIFHAESPGHDGAIVIDQSRIERLGVHLPLTNKLQKVGGGGTRHAAALGLAERCDAMVVAISEERGTISIAHESELTVVDAAELSDRLSSYAAKEQPSTRASSFLGLQNLAMKCTAVLLATTLWFLFAYRTDTIQRTFSVPVEYRNLPAEWEVDEHNSTFVNVTLSGPEPAFSLLDPATLTVSLELEQIDRQGEFPMPTAPSLKNVPKDLSVERTIPAVISVEVQAKSGE